MKPKTPTVSTVLDLTPEHITKIALRLGLTYNNLRQLVSGKRGASSARAISIEKAAKRIGLVITRESLNSGCASCEFARTCRVMLKAKEKLVK